MVAPVCKIGLQQALPPAPVAMLLRSSSTPGLLAAVLSEKQLESGEADAKSCSVSSAFSPIHTAEECGPSSEAEWDFEGEVVPWPRYRKVQSEGDLASMAMQPVAASSTSTTTTPGKQWSRRMSLSRHSSLPVPSRTPSGGKSILDSILDEFQSPLLPGVAEARAEDESELCISKLPVEGFLDVDRPLTMGDPGSGATSWTNSAAVLPSAGVSRESRGTVHMDGPMYIGGGGGIGMVGGDGSGGRRKCGGGGRQSSDGGGGGGEPNAAVHYRRLLDADPCHPLLLRNYARYLHEVEKDYQKAEEYYGRAILASPEDAELRSQYARFIWEVHQDQDRASGYFEQAAQAAPEDCYILGAYAAFMWDTEEQQQQETSSSSSSVSKEMPLMGTVSA